MAVDDLKKLKPGIFTTESTPPEKETAFIKIGNGPFFRNWGNIRVSELDRKQIIKLIEKLGQEAPIQANRKLATLKKCLAYAVDVGLLNENPAASVKKPGIENTKDRVLETKELTTLIRFLSDYSDKTAADILRLITLTAARPGEVCSMKLEHLKSNGL